MSKRYAKPAQRKEIVLREIPIPKEYQRELVAALLESAYCKGPEEIMDALRKCAENTDAGKYAQEGTKKQAVPLHAMIGKFHDINGKNALHYACLGGRSANVEYILKLCPSIAPLKDRDGETALMAASLKGDDLIVNALLHLDKAVNATNQMGVTALHLAAESGNTTCIRVLIESGAEVNCYSEITGTPLLYAVMNNHYEATQELLKHKADPNYPFNIKGIIYPSFPPPLLYACSAREDTLAELLLAHQADPNVRDKQSWTALQCAAESGAYRAARLLVESKANPDVITEGVTAFDLAIEHRNWAIADLLKDRTSVLSGDQRATWLKGLRIAYSKRLELNHERKKREAQAVAGIKDAATQKQFDDSMILQAEGDAYNQAGDCVLAADKYTEALKLLPNLPATDKQRAVLLASRSMMYLTFGDIVAAEKDANEATELHPLWSKGYSAKARVYKAKKESDQYTKHLYEALIREDVRDEELMAELKHAVEMAARDQEHRAQTATKG